MLIDRQADLAHLERRYRSGGAELFVLYGRRRVGKTELLRAFCQDKPHLFFIATLASDADQLAAFSQAVWRLTHAEAPAGFTFPSWEAALGALAELPGRPVVVLDEFTYLVSGHRALPSILQKVWDERLRAAGLMLILCGSYIGMIEREVLAYGAPLYGRRTASLLLEPLDLPAAAQFFPGYDPLTQIVAWAILGGMPYYLATFSDAATLEENIREHILDTRGLLYNEPQLLFLEELREPRNYFSILRAIASGCTRLNEIAQAAGVGGATTTVRYLDILRELRLVERRVPVTEPQPEKSKRGHFRVADPFLRFWFRYVQPQRGALDLGLADTVLARDIRPTLDAYVGPAFEEAARAYVARRAREQGSGIGSSCRGLPPANPSTGRGSGGGHGAARPLQESAEPATSDQRPAMLPFLPERLGAWWDRDAEIDLAALSDREGAALVGECKWWAQPVGENVLDELIAKRQRMDPAGRWPHVTYALFSKSGFTPALRARAAREGVWLVEARELV